MHAAQKVHRDIKPTNVLVTPGGRVVLLDFGLATDVDRPDRLDSGTSIVGTAAYMAPEQADALAVGPEADWYALGAVLYEALTGRPPFSGTPLEILVHKQSYEPPPPRTLDPEVPRDLDALCSALLRRSPRDRPSTTEILERVGAPPPASVRAGGSSPAVHDTQPFVGRARELASLTAALAEAERGLPISMFVLGESGMGKSSLVRRFLDRLDESRGDVLVLSGRCYERESVPFKAFDDVVDALAAYLTRADKAEVEAGLPADIAPLVRLFPVLRRVPALARAGVQIVSDPQELRVRGFAALRAVLVKLARARPVVVYVDDFQWADADSLALFSSVMHGLEAPPLLFVATVRAAPADVAAGKLPPALGSVESVPGDLRTLSVLGLPPEEAFGLAEHLLGAGGAAAHEVRALVEEAGGHPLFIQELVRHLGGAPGGRAAVLLDEALWTRIGTIEPAARRVLEIAAVAGEPLPPRVAMLAAGLDPGELSRVVGVLRVASLIRTGGTRGGDVVECYHDRIREAVVARLDGATARRHHEALANALESAGGPAHDVQAVVRHLEAAGLTERAAEQAGRAGRAAAEALAFDRAAAMYELALRLGTAPAEVARKLRIEMGDALVNAGRGTDAAEAYLAAAEGADAATRLECRRKAAGHLLIAGDIERGVATIDDVLAEFGERLPPTARSGLRTFLWNRAVLRVRGIGFKPRDESEISPRDLLMIDIYHSIGIGLGLVDTVRGAGFQARGLRLALQVGERRRVIRAIALDAGIMASQGPRANARAMKLIARCAELLGDARDPYLEGWVVGGFGFAHYLGGRFTAGAEKMLQAEALFRAGAHGNIWEFNTMRVFRLFSLRLLGRWREMRAELADHLRDAARRGDRYAATTMTRGINIAWLVVDEPARARKELDSARWSPPQGGYHMQHWYELRSRIELGIYEQDTAMVRELLAEGFAPLGRSMLERAQTLRTDARWTRGRAALYCHAEGGGDELLGVAAAMVKALIKEGMPYTQAWAAMLQAGIAARRGDAEAQTARLRDVVRLAGAADLRMCAAAARHMLGDVRGEDLMFEEGVKNPHRIAAMLLPGVVPGPAV